MIPGFDAAALKRKAAVTVAGVMFLTTSTVTAGAGWYMTHDTTTAATIGGAGGVTAAVVSLALLYAGARVARSVMENAMSDALGPLAGVMAGGAGNAADPDGQTPLGISSDTPGLDGLADVTGQDDALDLDLDIEDGGGCTEAWDAACNQRNSDGEHSNDN